MLDEPLCLVSAAQAAAAARRAHAPAAAAVRRARPSYPLVVPEHTHAIRRLLETQATLAGLKLNIAYEVSSVPAILELVRHGHGHAVLDAERGGGLGPRGGRCAVRPLAERVLTSTLCMAHLGHKPPTPLSRQASALLRELVVASVGGRAAA